MFTLKVFVSSPIKGLEAERKAAKEALDILFLSLISVHQLIASIIVYQMFGILTYSFCY